MGKIHTNASNKMMMMVIYKYMDVKQVLTNICNSFSQLSIVVSLLFLNVMKYRWHRELIVFKFEI